MVLLLLMMALSIGAGGAVRALRAVVVGAKVDSLAAEGAAVVDEFLVLLDGHIDGYVRVQGDEFVFLREV